MTYNVTSFTNMQDFFGATNNFSGGWFWTLMLSGLAIVIFVITQKITTTDRAFFTTGLGSWLIGSFFFFLGWINWMIYALTIFALVGELVAVISRQEQEGY
jgi:hypothetical protein